MKQTTARLVIAALASVGCDSESADEGQADEGTGTSGASEGADTSGDPTTAGSGSDESGGEPLDCTDEVFDPPTGELIISDEADLEMLRGYRRIDGALSIEASTLTNVDALGCLEEIGAELVIFNNESLADISGLDNVRTVGAECGSENSWCSNIAITNNPALVEIAGMNSVVSLTGTLNISQNASLTSITGLTMLEAIEKNLLISRNDSLTTIRGLRGLRAIGQSFKITNNPNLCKNAEVFAVGDGLEYLPPAEEISFVNNDESC